MIFEIDANLTLRLLQSDDATQLFTLVDQNREYLREWLPWLDHNNNVEASEAFIATTQNQFQSGKGFSGGVFLNDILVGMCGYHPINNVNQSVTIGYWLSENSQGSGIITRCADFLIQYAFNDLKLNKVLIPVAESNPRSRSVCERLQLTNEGIERDAEFLYGRYVDHVMYSILESEWKSRK